MAPSRQQHHIPTRQTPTLPAPELYRRPASTVLWTHLDQIRIARRVEYFPSHDHRTVSDTRGFGITALEVASIRTVAQDLRACGHDFVREGVDVVLDNKYDLEGSDRLRIRVDNATGISHEHCLD